MGPGYIPWLVSVEGQGTPAHLPLLRIGCLREVSTLSNGLVLFKGDLKISLRFCVGTRDGR